MSATLNGLRAVSVRVLVPYQGVWIADVDLDPDIVATAPTSGPATIVIGAPPVATLLGIIDPLFSGSFVAAAKVRVVGGFGGWSKSVPSQDFENPAGVLSPAVLVPTGALVGEKVTVLEPELLAAASYARSAGPARRVLEGRSWWVDPTTGVTFVGPRPPAPPDPSLQVLDWDPDTKTAELASDTLILPGTPLVDTRIGESPVIVRDVEQTFDTRGSRATAWCSTGSVSRLQVALKALIRELAKTAHLKCYRYRVVAPPPGDTSNTKWNLQAVDRDSTTGAASPMPDLIPGTVWTGMSGVLAKVAPSLEVLVHFVDGDPGQPVVVGFSTLELPLELDLDATVALNLGILAPLVKLAGGGAPVGRVGDEVTITIDATAAGGLTAPGGSGGPCTLTSGPIAVKGTITKGSLKVQSG